MQLRFVCQFMLLAAPAYAQSENTNYCGANWSDASSNCQAGFGTCPGGINSECPDGMACFGGITCTTADTPQDNGGTDGTITSYCGVDFNAANSCETACPGGTQAECPEGMSCYGGFTECGVKYPVSHSDEILFRDCVGREDEKLFVLSFDDGPHMYTAGILDVLKEKAAPATFFVIGSIFEDFPNAGYEQLLLRMVREGHTVANHGMTNDPFLVSEVEECHEILEGKTNGYQSQFFRPAQGAYTITRVEELRQALRGYQVAMWNIDTTDWQADRNPQDILDLIEGALENPTEEAPVSDTPNHGFPRRGSFVMLAHGNKETFLKPVTISAGQQASRQQEVPLLAAMIDLIRSKGYEIVTMEECMGVAQATLEPTITASPSPDLPAWTWEGAAGFSGSRHNTASIFHSLLASASVTLIMLATK
jgi:peptidoglycan/xylan/chitin deacetylase (PgdA/CDA1 family)